MKAFYNKIINGKKVELFELLNSNLTEEQKQALLDTRFKKVLSLAVKLSN